MNTYKLDRKDDSPLVPNVIIIGAMRCGTTSLFRYLAHHPEVCIGIKKELNVFIEPLSAQEDEIRNKYNSIFKQFYRGQAILLEASPLYLRKSKEILQAIKSVLPSTKIILLLREPVSRAISIYKSIERSGTLRPNVSFDKFIDSTLTQTPNLDIFTNKEYRAGMDDAKGIWTEIFRVSRYSNIVGDVYNSFGNDQVFIGFLENLSAHPYETIIRMCKFLEINSDIYKKYFFQVENPTINARWPKVYTWVLRLNSQLEPCLNQAPKMRSWIRNIHHKFNGTRDQDAYKIETINRLKRFYGTDRKVLLEVLQKGKVSYLPPWLSG